jgi:hypothetical protein
LHRVGVWTSMARPFRPSVCFLIFLTTFLFTVCGRLSADDLDRLSSAVVYLRGSQSSGTGFFLVTSRTAYLVTADHVAKGMTGSDQAILRGSSDRPTRLSLKNLHGQTQLAWIKHAEADVTVLPLKLSDHAVVALKGHVLPMSCLFREDRAPARIFWLAVIGFPLNLGVEGRFSPLSRRTHASSGLLRFPRFDTGRTTTFFVLEDPSVQGYSGGPVFQMTWPTLDGGGMHPESLGLPWSRP